MIEPSGRFSRKTRLLFTGIAIAIFLVVATVMGVARAGEGQKPSKALTPDEKKWGVRILSLRPTAGGHMLDLRYQVTDAAKAADVLKRQSKAFIVDQGTGKALPVPVSKVGPLRQTTFKPEAGRIYFALFSNPGGFVKKGSQVTVVIGDFKANDIIVENSDPERTPEQTLKKPLFPPALQINLPALQVNKDHKEKR